MLKRALTVASAIASIAAAPAPPGGALATVVHHVILTDDDLALLDFVRTEIGKLCPISDADCAAKLRLSDLAARVGAQIAAEPKPTVR